jgi:hypothetical protein
MYAELTIDQGSTFSTTIELTNDDNTPINLSFATANTFSSQIRKSYYSTNPTANISVTVDNAANGVVRLSIDSANTANIKPGRYLYDLKMVNEANTTIRIVEGIITISPQVSR